ncbi:MAG: hypothetical protein ACK5PP_20165 [Acidimicrobiales bacterium]
MAIPVGGLVFVAAERTLVVIHPLPAWCWFWAIITWFMLLSVVLSRVEIADEMIRVHNPVSTFRIPIGDARVTVGSPRCGPRLVCIETPQRRVRCWGLSARRYTVGADDVAPFCRRIQQLGGRVGTSGDGRGERPGRVVD